MTRELSSRAKNLRGPQLLFNGGAIVTIISGELQNTCNGGLYHLGKCETNTGKRTHYYFIRFLQQ